MRTSTIVLAILPLALVMPAHADTLFNDAVNITVQNSPSSDSGVFQIGDPATALGTDGLTVSVQSVSAGGGKEWIVFTYRSSEGPLSQPDENWSVAQYLNAKVDVSIIGDFTQFTDASGAPFNQTSSIFGQTLMSNPVPGGTGNGEGTLGYDGPLGSGALVNLGAYASPFSVVTGHLGTTEVYGFTSALEFQATNAVPEPATWAMMAFGFAALVGLSWRRADRNPRALA